MNYVADFTDVPRGLVAEIPQRRSWVYWLVVVVSVLLIALYAPALILIIVMWSSGLFAIGGAVETVGWVAVLPVLLILFVFQCGFPFFAMWFALPAGFGTNRVTVEDGVLESRVAYRWMRLPARRFSLGQYRDSEVSVEKDHKGRPHISVRADRAMPVFIGGQMVETQASDLAEAIRACAASAQPDVLRAL